jgi:hypothetical protein
MKIATLDQLGNKLDQSDLKKLFIEAMHVPQTNFDDWKTAYLNEQHKDTVSLSGILNVMDDDDKYASVKKAIKELIAQ